MSAQFSLHNLAMDLISVHTPGQENLSLFFAFSDVHLDNILEHDIYCSRKEMRIGQVGVDPGRATVLSAAVCNIS